MERPLLRAVGLPSAAAINIATMIGAGPMITIPIVFAALHGSFSLYPWLAGAAIAMADGLVYAELASRFPRTGGTYVYLREAFGSTGPGRLIAFLFVWMIVLSVPLILASGYIGFAQYAAYLLPAADTPAVRTAIAAAVGALTLASLYRAIPQVARTALVLGAVALATVVAVALCGLAFPVNDVPHLAAAAFSPHALEPAAFGAALVIVLYDYAGYTDVCSLGDEVIAPRRTIPLAIVLSVIVVACAYVLFNLGVLAAIPGSAVASSTFIASAVVEHGFGRPAAVAITLAVLVTAFASTYGGLLGASRIPYAAAVDGDFLPAFARVHATKRFPHIALLAVGLLALPATLLPLDALIAAATAGLVLVSGIGANLAVLRLRATQPPAPFRLPLYPLPPLVALGGWAFLFWSSGSWAMLFGAIALALGAAVFLVHAQRSRIWPYASAAVVLLAVIALGRTPAGAATFTHARIVPSSAGPRLEVDGRPFFFFGGAFFYERLPPERWDASLGAMRALGANTLDLYVPWNWHETADGAFDFDGHGNPRRNLRLLLRLARAHGFHLIVRPGPVIRNEWRNGGYPDWLLQRPAYGMPLHDVLEGRYPATATLQNAHSDAAAAEWLRNQTHRRYATRWLHAALREFVPYADLVLAVALDDDQGAYIDNDTWPAPNLQRYLRWLDARVREIVGPQLPTFINTYDMKVPASAPVWAMGNWYQSDAYRIGEHDRVELDFAAATLTTQERTPLGISEFQAGWLASPEDPQPRPADPTNTTLALGELLAWGAHGVVDFPLQDTLAPFGWEAPFSNAFYAWDAAVPYDPAATSARYAPTRRFGRDVARYGATLAAAQRIADIAIVDAVSALDPRTLTNAAVGAIAASLKDALRTCNARGLTCDVVDLRFSSDARLRRYATIVVPPLPAKPHAPIARRVAALGTRIAGAVPNRRGPGLTVLDGPRGALAVAVNWSDATRSYGGSLIAGGRRYAVPSFTVAARDAAVVPLERVRPEARATTVPSYGRAAPPATSQRIALNATQGAAVTLPLLAQGEARVVVGAALGSGERTVMLVNDRVVAIVAPDGGARLVAFARRERRSALGDLTDATGALRDDALLQPPPSPTDRIARYTHSYPAGTFNRAYRVDVLSPRGASVRVRFSYAAPDVVPHGARFVKTLALDAGATRLVVDEEVAIPDGDTQRAVRYDALAVAPGTAFHSEPTFVAWRDGAALAVTWPVPERERTSWTPARSNGTLMQVLAATPTRTTYALGTAASRDEALRFAQSERDWLAAHPR